jgi:hypothetical protein
VADGIVMAHCSWKPGDQLGWATCLMRSDRHAWSVANSESARGRHAVDSNTRSKDRMLQQLGRGIARASGMVKALVPRRVKPACQAACGVQPGREVCRTCYTGRGCAARVRREQEGLG